MENNTGELDALIQEKLDADTDFAASLADLSDEDKEQAIQTKKSEILSQEVKSLREKAEKAAKAEELANNYKVRAEKAERELGKNKPAAGDKTPKKDGELSSRDIIVLTKANIAEEDIDEVLDYAKFKGISVAEALKSSVVKATLSQKEEQRNLAAAANAGNGRRGSYQVADDVLLAKARQGELPDSDADLDRLVEARMKAKMAK